MEPKYKIGEQVKFLKDQDSQSGEIVSFSYDSNEGEFRYTFTSEAYDPGLNRMVTGVKHCLESEIVEIGTEPILDEIVVKK